VAVYGRRDACVALTGVLVTAGGSDVVLFVTSLVIDTSMDSTHRSTYRYNNPLGSMTHIQGGSKKVSCCTVSTWLTFLSHPVYTVRSKELFVGGGGQYIFEDHQFNKLKTELQ